AGMNVTGEALEPIGDKLHRPANELCDHGDGDLVGINVNLDAVAAADVAADDAHVPLGEPHMFGEHALHHVRSLCGVVDGEPAGRAVEIGQNGARLDGEPRVTTAVESRLYDLVRMLKRFLDLARLIDALKTEIVAELGMDHRRCS